MRSRRLALVIVVAVVTVSCATAQDAPGAGIREESLPLPALELEALDGGETVALDDRYGSQPAAINFWASWCPPCAAEMPDFERVHQDVGDRVAFVGIGTQDQLEPARELVRETGVSYELLRDPDGEAARAFEVFGMPSTYFVSDGAIVDRHTGLMTEEQLRERLAELFDVS